MTNFLEVFMQARSNLLPFVIRGLITRDGHDAKIQVRESLGTELQAWYEDPSKHPWLPIDEYCRFMEEMAALFFPSDPYPIRALASEEIEFAFSKGIANLVMRLADVSAILPVFSALWKSYYSAGRPSHAREGKQFFFRVAEAPALPPVGREYLAGFFQKAFSMVDRQAYLVAVEEIDGPEWQWTIAPALSRST